MCPDPLIFSSPRLDHRLAYTYRKNPQHQKLTFLPATFDLSIAPNAWQRLVVSRVGGERVLDRKQLEACVFVCLANELRSGDVAVDDTKNYPDTRAQMLPWAECAPLVAAWAAEMDLPPTASVCVADLRERLTAAAALVDQQFPEQDQLSISPEGVPVLKRLPRRDIPRSAYLLERRLLGRMPDRHLLDMVAAVGS